MNNRKIKRVVVSVEFEDGETVERALLLQGGDHISLSHFGWGWIPVDVTRVGDMSPRLKAVGEYLEFEAVRRWT